MKFLFLLSLLAGCAGPIEISDNQKGEVGALTRPVEPFTVRISNGILDNVWFADGGPSRLVVFNRSDFYQQVHVVCNPSVDINYIDRGHIEWWTCMNAHSDKIRLVEFMNIDAINPNVCSVEEHYPSAPGLCYEQK